MICIYTGLPGAGKSQKMAKTMLDILVRNRKWYKKSGILRKVHTNMRLSPQYEHEFGEFLAPYWTDPEQLVKMRDCDVFIDEIATYFDSTQWANMPLPVKRWLQQHRKFGIEIYGTTQDFAMIDKSMRRMTTDLFLLKKLFGSRDKSTTKPDPKWIWGLVALRELDPTTYDEQTSKFQTGLPGFMWIDREGTQIFDTTQEIKSGKYPSLNHIERDCSLESCSFTKIVHA